MVFSRCIPIGEVRMKVTIKIAAILVAGALVAIAAQEYRYF